MGSEDFVQFALQISVMLGTAMLFGQLMRRLRQPAVLGEMIGGIVLGPTVFAAIAPELHASVFGGSASVTVARDAFIKLGMLFFMFIAGLEIDLSDLRRMGRQATLIGAVGTLLPIAAGVGLVYALPRDFWGPTVQAHFLSFALFIGMNLANSANPVIARILMDLGLLRTEIYATIMTATIVDDLVNWTLFAIILKDLSPGAPAASAGLPASLLSVAFFVGVALSGSGRRKDAYKIVRRLSVGFFAPIFFVSMGLNADFIANFDLRMASIILAAALTSKVGAVLLGARLAGMPLDRRTLAIAFGLNARGATGILLASVGLSTGMIDPTIFVAIVVMCLITSLLAGPAMNALLRPEASEARVPQVQPGAQAYQ